MKKPITINLNGFSFQGYFGTPETAKEATKALNDSRPTSEYVAVDRNGHYEVWGRVVSPIKATLL